MDTKNKPLWRMIIEKLFCHHQFRTIEKIESKDAFGNIKEITVLRECYICGKDKTRRI